MFWTRLLVVFCSFLVFNVTVFGKLQMHYTCRCGKHAMPEASIAGL